MTESNSKPNSADAETAGGGAGITATILLGFLFLLGIFMSAHAVTTGFGLMGGLLSAFAVLMLFRVIAVLYPSQH